MSGPWFSHLKPLKPDETAIKLNRTKNSFNVQSVVLFDSIWFFKGTECLNCLRKKLNMIYT